MFRLCLWLPSSPDDGCCEIWAGFMVFDALVFWGNSHPGAVDQADNGNDEEVEEAEIPVCQ